MLHYVVWEGLHSRKIFISGLETFDASMKPIEPGYLDEGRSGLDP